MTYRDPDSGLEFASYDAYREAREGPYEPERPDPTDEEICASFGHGPPSGYDCKPHRQRPRPLSSPSYSDAEPE